MLHQESYSSSALPLDTGSQSGAFDPLQALDRGEFVPYFQPIVTLRTGKLEGFEVLARWQNPVRGLVMPDEFIPQAEADGWIGALTLKMLETSFAAARDIPAPLSLAVNVSKVQLRDMLLPAMVRATAETYGFPLDRLILEITESALSEDYSCGFAAIEELKAAGCKIALDDFGTGYSSLLQLQALPFDLLKVDRGFVNSMTENRQSRKIVGAVVGLGQGLGLKTVAEGVETQEQVEILSGLGCELVQGWLYGRPVSAEALADVTRAFDATPRPKLPGLTPGLMSADTLPSQRLAHLQAVYDGAPVGLGFLDRDLRYVIVNRRLADMNGRPVEEHLGSPVEEIIPELFPQVKEYLHRAIEGEAISGVEVVVPPTGEVRLISYQPALDEAGEVVGVSVATIDITARKLAEEALRLSEEHYRHILELNRHLLWFRKDLTLEVTPRADDAVNLLKKTAAKILGLSDRR